MQHYDSLLYDSDQSKQTTGLKTVNFIDYYNSMLVCEAWPSTYSVLFI